MRKWRVGDRLGFCMSCGGLGMGPFARSLAVMCGVDNVIGGFW